MKVKVKQDAVTKDIAKMFDYDFNGETEFIPPRFELPQEYNIGLIVGASGSGKSSILNTIGIEEQITWPVDKCIASAFGTSNKAKQCLSGVGFNSIPSWLRPYYVLSTGEKFRADMARRIKTGAVIDEFTSVVDRKVAASCANAVNRYIHDQSIKRVTFASCHRDIIEWLRPDWVFDTKTGELSGRLLRKPDITFNVNPCGCEKWGPFSSHHYLSENINKSAHCWLVKWGAETVGFTSILAFPSGSFKRAWREHRTVVLPEFQGLGIGVRISDAIGEILITQGKRFFSKTVHPHMGKYRDKSELWRPTSKNHMKRKDYNHNRVTKESGYKDKHTNRWAYSHEYIGNH